MNWTTKAGMQRLLAVLPGGARIYRCGQRLAGDLRSPPVARKVKQGLALLEAGRKADFTPVGQSGVEWGTGWAPLLPLLFWLHGQTSCHTLDVERLLRPGLQLSAVRHLLTHLPADGPLLPERRRQLERLLQGGHQVADLWRLARIQYLAPVDTTATGLPAGGTDFLYSNAVLEHVPADLMPALFAEAQRLLRPGGVMLHQIDLSDHFAHGDRTISPINFLQFSSETFRKYNSTFLYQNRLRAPAYRQMVEAAGFAVVFWEEVVSAAATETIDSLTIDPQFAAFSLAELCTTEIRFTAVSLG